MHIAFVTSEYPSPHRPAGGLANYLKKTATELQKRDHQVTIFLLSSQDSSLQEGEVTIEEICATTVFPRRFSKIPVLRIIASIATNIHTAWQIKKRIAKNNKKEEIDIIQIPLMPHAGTMALFLLRNRSAPLIGRLSFDTISYNKISRNNIRNISYQVSTMIEQFQLKKLDGIFGPCKKIANIVQNRKKVEVRVIRTPLETIEIPLSNMRSEVDLPDQPFFLYFSQFELFKGFDIAFEASRSLLARHPHASILFLGTPKANCASKWANELLQLTKTNKKQFKYNPPIPKNMLYPLIQQCTAVLMPARLDNYPNSCLEAQMLGAIVIGTYDSGLDEIIIPGNTGFLAQKDNVQSFIKEMEFVLTMRDKDRQKMQANILAHIDIIRKEDRVGALLSYYDEIIEQNHERQAVN